MSKFISNTNGLLLAGSAAVGCSLMAYKWWTSAVTTVVESKPCSMAQAYEKIVPVSQEALSETPAVKTVQVVDDVGNTMPTRMERLRRGVIVFARQGLKVLSFLKAIFQWIVNRLIKKRRIYTGPKTTCMEKAVKMGDITSMLWILEINGCPWGNDTFAWATSDGNMEVLQWLKRSGYPWGAFTCTHEIRTCDETISKWLGRNGRHWDEYSLAIAVLCQDIAVLKWLGRNGCLCDKSTFQRATRGDTIHILELESLQANACPH